MEIDEKRFIIKKECLICGTNKKITKHHLRSGKEIPLCRRCHDEVEEAKVYINLMKSRKSAYKKGYEAGKLKKKQEE